MLVRSLKIVLMSVALCGGALPVVVCAAPAAALSLYSIPRQDLGQALMKLAQEANRNITFAPDQVQGRMSPSVTSAKSFEAALTALLANSGLTYRIETDGSTTIVQAAPSNSSSKSIRASDQADAGQTEEVVVTAERRSERLQHVPVAITALSGADLDNQRMTSIQDISRVTPGLTISSYSYSKPDISMRGSYNNVSQIGVDTPVAVILDDVYITRPAGQIFNLYDLDSVQVLRGPQGTLFGRNVTGGAILLTTSKPSFTDTQYSGEVSYGNYDQVEVNALVSGPIDDNMAAKLVVSHTGHDGYGRDALTGRSEDDEDNTNLRAQFRVSVGDVDSLFSADYSMDDNGGRALVSLGAGASGNPRVSELGVDQLFGRHMGGLSNNTIWDIPGDNGVVTAITAYRTMDMHEVFSQSGVSYLFLTSGSQSIYDDSNNVKDFSEEVRYNSPQWDTGDFVAGLYYLNDNAKEPLYITNLAAKTGSLTSSTAAYQTASTSSISGYFDANINLPQNFRLTLGARYTNDAKTARLNYVNVLNASGSFDSGNLSRSFAKFTPRAVLSWKVDDENMVYASITKGFTSGGFDTGDTTLAAVVQGFQPETVTSYEAGAKSYFFDGRVTANLAVFEMKFHNKQEFVFNTLTHIGNITNAAAATARGAELEVGLHPIDGLDIGLSYAKLDTKYNSFVVPGLLNYTGNQLGYSPRNKFSAKLHYEWPLSDIGIALANVSYAWTDHYHISAATNQNPFAVPQYALVDANVGYETPDRHYRLSLWGKNLTNQLYELVATNTGTLAEYYGAPRTFGGSISVNF